MPSRYGAVPLASLNVDLLGDAPEQRLQSVGEVVAGLDHPLPLRRCERVPGRLDHVTLSR